jgi:RimJ/RimL family protein N-acetyltransferase
MTVTMTGPLPVPPFPIRTERLDLRPFEEADLDAMAAYRANVEVVRYLYWEPQNRDQARAALATRRNQVAFREEGDTVALAVVVRETGAMVGEVCLTWRSAEHRQAEVGFVIHPDHQGSGYAAEATRAVLALGFDTCGFHRIRGSTDPRNLASCRLMERLGMRREAHLVENEWFKGAWGDEVIYAMLDREWSREAPRQMDVDPQGRPG